MAGEVPVACDGPQGPPLDAVAASGHLAAEEGPGLLRSMAGRAWPSARQDNLRAVGRAVHAALSRSEPTTGAGPGAALVGRCGGPAAATGCWTCSASMGQNARPRLATWSPFINVTPLTSSGLPSGPNPSCAVPASRLGRPWSAARFPAVAYRD